MSAHHKETNEKDYKHHLPLTFSHFNSSYLQSDTHYMGEGFSYNQDGLCFLTSDPLHPGATILIKMGTRSTANLRPETWEGIRTISLAKVEWCRPNSDEKGPRYKVGVKYHEPDY